MIGFIIKDRQNHSLNVLNVLQKLAIEKEKKRKREEEILKLFQIYLFSYLSNFHFVTKILVPDPSF